MDVSDLVGVGFGPSPFEVTSARVTDFAEVTGDDPNRWASTAPPGFAAAALFAVAPQFLDQVGDRSVIHGEQTFEWHTPITVASTLEVTGIVTAARERGGAHFVRFDVTAEDDGRGVLGGTSLFVVTSEAKNEAAEFERPEPHHSHRGAPQPGQFSASRADLIRYAAATRDWNPIHWDHDAAVLAGLPGVVVHGLLQAGWAFAAVGAHVGGPRPFSRAKVRFRNPLTPARPVDVTIASESGSFDVTIADGSTTYVTANIEVADQ